MICIAELKNIISEFEIICLSISLNEVPINKLGRFTFKNIKNALYKIKNDSDISECVILQKCNCVEVYAISKRFVVDIKEKLIKFWIENARDFDKSCINSIVTLRNHEVFEHLLKTACGLKSLLTGDAQVLGQVRKARKLALEVGVIGVVFDNLFNHARFIDKRIRNETKFHSDYISIERTVSDIINNTQNKKQKIAIIGIGEMGSLITKSLKEKHFTNVILCNRTHSTAKYVAEKYGFETELYENQKELLKKMDIVIYSVNSSNCLLTKKYINLLSKREKPLMIIDIGNPPNVDISISKLKNITLINLDSIKNYTKYALENRIKEIPKVEGIIKEEQKIILNKINRNFIDRKISKNIQEFNLNLKNKKTKSIFILKDHIIRYIREFLFSKQFIEVQTPCIITVATDPIKDPKAELFSVDWYGKRVFLRQSMQLHKQMLIISGLKRLFEIGSFWRANIRQTKRHSSESLGLDVEMSDITSHKNIMNLLEEMICFVIKRLKNKDGNLLKILNVKLIEPKRPFLRISYQNAIEILQKNNIKIKYGEDIGIEREMLLYQILNRKNKLEFFFIENYPNTVKKFYVKPAKIQGLTNTFDLNFKGWELSSGAQRETNLKNIIKKMKDNKLSPKKYNFYLNMFKKYKAPSHGGFGMGVERFVAKLLDFDDVCKVILFPRTEEIFAP